ncbi:MSHA biogenesis protein MshI [Enterovibrio paralichthyis]|uniref:MSHA biogenesis protein MshI n=1 Tax=Enterovibrio paralichthyis TaxID=2853805 RepID=UPI001C465169|nr:MSHA biogenesis protein MshI [Enterovibrio paralichthyis]MBV7297986.1 MSHA biogenesis protein MshI [Enterovibrio paralichthyis]
MAVSTFLARFTPVRQRDVVSFVVSANQVVLAYRDEQGHAQIDTLSVTQSDPWTTALQLLKRHGITKTDVQLVLGHGLYQSLLIDEPGLSDEDKRAALPFKLKDFIADTPSDVVADGFSLPIANRFQAFVCHKLPLIQFSQALEKSQCRLTLVSLEDVVLRHWTQLDKTEMVLSRDCHGLIQLAVFHQGKLCFQRQIRGLMLDSMQMLPLVVDDLALEIQRSLDYLRSQLKAAQLSALVVSVEGIDDTELAFQLSSRLSVTVRPQQMFSQGNHYEHIAKTALGRDISPDINLFHDDLAPKAPLLTFDKMLLVWGLTALLLVLVAAYQQWQHTQSEQLLKIANNELQAAQRLSDELNAQLKLHLPSPSLANDIRDAEAALVSKRQALNAVRQHDASLQKGYADTFRALAALSRPDVSVSEIAVSQQAMDIKGLASTPSSVPAWLQTFSTHPPLAKRTFEEMALTRDEKNRLQFSLVSRREKEEVAQ